MYVIMSFLSALTVLYDILWIDNAVLHDKRWCLATRAHQGHVHNSETWRLTISISTDQRCWFHKKMTYLRSTNFSMILCFQEIDKVPSTRSLCFHLGRLCGQSPMPHVRSDTDLPQDVRLLPNLGFYFEILCLRLIENYSLRKLFVNFCGGVEFFVEADTFPSHA